MEIQEFVSSVIVQIVKGLNVANEELKNSHSGAVVNPTTIHNKVHEKNFIGERSVQQIDMSIAVTASESSSAGGKGSLNIAVFKAEFGGEASNSLNSTVSTVKFTVPIAFPVGK